MCGIAGIFNNHISNGDLSITGKMIRLLRHRGPEETGLYVDNHISLAHARLSIIDLSEGVQPIHNEDKTLWIIFNGEIFNYPELRQDLIKSGHKFYTKTDTEVIVHLYEKYGTDCLQKLNGQFAFAIWDSVKHELFLARDRVGIIPLFYRKNNKTISFASEIKALLADPTIKRNLNARALDQIFTFWTTLGDNTFFEDIYELPPAHYLLTDLNNFIIENYWELQFAHSGNYQDFKRNDLIDQVEELLLDSVRIRLRSDVPVGSYLSGGLDSSGITSFIKNKFNNKLNTFGITFEDKRFDESFYQEKVVEYLNVNHSELFINNKDISSNFESVLWHTEKPLLRTAPVPLFLLSSLVHRNNYKVVLTGEGSDEVFGGYNIFREAKIRNFWSKYPESKLRPLLLGKLYPYIFKDKRLGKTTTEFFRSGITDPNNPLFSHLIRWNNTSRIKLFFSDEFKSGLNGYNALANLIELLPDEFNNWDYLAKAQYLEIIVFMSNYLLSSQGDRMAMANSVETRTPFLDHRIIELMSTVDPEFKLNLLNEKYILKEVFRNKLPSEILTRPKHPYRAPIEKGLLGGDKKLEEQYLSENNLEKTGIFDLNKVSLFLKKIRKAESTSEIDAMSLAGILSTQIIYEKFINSYKIDFSENLEFSIVFDNRTLDN